MGNMHDHKQCTYCNKELKEWQQAAGKKYCGRGCSASYLVLRNKARSKGKLRSDQMKAMRKKYGHNYHQYLPGLNEITPGWIPEYSEDGWDWTDSKGKEHVIVVDIAHPRHRIAIEFDGPDHTHDWDWQRGFDPARDNERDKVLKKKRWTVLRITQWPTVAALLSATADVLLKKRAINISDEELTYELTSPSPERTLSINTNVSREDLVKELTANTKIAIQQYDRTIRQIGKLHRATTFWNGVPNPSGEIMMQRLYQHHIPLSKIIVGGLMVVLDSTGKRVFFSGTKYATDAYTHPKIIRNESEWRKLSSEMKMKGPFVLHHFPRKKVVLAQESYKARIYQPMIRTAHKLISRFIRNLEAELDYSIEIPNMRLTRDPGEFDVKMYLRTEVARRLFEVTLKITSLGKHQIEVKFWNRLAHYKEFRATDTKFERVLDKELGFAYSKVLPKMLRRIENAKDEGPRNIKPKWIGEKLRLYKGSVGENMNRTAALKLELAASKLDANHNYELAMQCRWAAVRIEANWILKGIIKQIESFAGEALNFILWRYSARLLLSFVGIYWESWLNISETKDKNARYELPHGIKDSDLEGLDPEKDAPPKGMNNDQMRSYFNAKKVEDTEMEKIRADSMEQAFGKTSMAHDIDEIFRKHLRSVTTGGVQEKTALLGIGTFVTWVTSYFNKLVFGSLKRIALKVMGKMMKIEEKKNGGNHPSKKTVENVVAESIERSLNSINVNKVKKDLKKAVKKYKLEIPKNITEKDVKRITDQNYLIQISLKYHKVAVRKAAISFLTDMQTLRKLYMYDKDRSVRDAAHARYQELSGK